MTTKQQKKEFELVQVEDIPVSAAVEIVRSDRCGTVEGLDEDELLTNNELDRMVAKQLWKPILDLPIKDNGIWIRPNIEQDGKLDWGAFGTVDFLRQHPFTLARKARYKAAKLKEELENAMIMASTIKDRISGRAKYKVLKYLKLGYLRLEDITNFDMNRLGNWCLKIWRLRKEIEQLSKYSRTYTPKRPRTFITIYREIDYEQLFGFLFRPWVIFLDYKGIW